MEIQGLRMLLWALIWCLLMFCVYPCLFVVLIFAHMLFPVELLIEWPSSWIVSRMRFYESWSPGLDLVAASGEILQRRMRGQLLFDQEEGLVGTHAWAPRIFLPVAGRLMEHHWWVTFPLSPPAILQDFVLAGMYLEKMISLQYIMSMLWAGHIGNNQEEGPRV